MIPVENDAADGGAAGHIRYSISELLKIGESAECHKRPNCYDTSSRIPWKRPESPEESIRTNGEKEKPKKVRETRERDVTSDRRIGSGRIFDRDAFWDNKLADGVPLNPPGRKERNGNANEWLERRGYSSRNPVSIFDTKKSRNEPIRRAYRDDTEPEWFSAGPTSKFDTVELHGFEDDVEGVQPAAGKASSTPVKVHYGNAQKKDETGFNIDKYLPVDSDYLTAPSDGGGSRFGQWFANCIPKTAQGSHDVSENRRMSILTDLENIMNDSQSHTASGSDMSKSVMDFMQMANVGATGHSNPPRHQNIANVKDIETSLRDCAIEKPAMCSENGDMAVFRNFVANMPNEQLVGSKVGVPPFLPDDKGCMRPFNVGRMVWGQPTLGSYVELLQTVISYGAHQLNRHELLHTPEAQESLQALMRGEMSVYHMLHHLQILRPGREQEIIIAVLWAFNQASQLVTLPRASFQFPYSRNGPADVMSAPLFPSTGQNLSGSSFSSGKAQRMPSARELHFHTQSIMQNALMRKRFEEQLGGFVNHPGGGQASPGRQGRQQLQGGFTPTSMLCKIVADKEADVPPPKEASEASII